MDDRRRKSLDRKTKSQLIDEIEMLCRRLDELDAASKYSPGAHFEAEGFAGLGTWTWDIENNRFYTSSEHYRILGVEPAGYLGHSGLVSTAVGDEDDLGEAV